jgi:hypothetical protein
MLSAKQRTLLQNLEQVADLKASIRESVIEGATSAERLDAKVLLLRREREAIDKIISEKTICFPWLATAIAEYHELCDIKLAEYLEGKANPAKSSARLVRKLAAEKREIRKRLLLATSRVKYYESLFPHLKEYVQDDIDDIVRFDPESLLVDRDDPARVYLTDAEFARLSEAERNQLALDRWKARKKPNWEIGRLYERYVGYMYEKSGCQVEYHGAFKGLGDLGRDLIVTAPNAETLIIQCKYWKKESTIREKHIFQLFGTTVEWFLRNTPPLGSMEPQLFPQFLKENRVRPVFYTTTSLSDEARDFACRLGVEVHERMPCDADYPMIKCNYSPTTKEKIYHLPFDQQYDRTLITDEFNEMYASTTQEAHNAGYRRARRWYGNS